MSEILQAENVAYSSPKEIFVNGLSRNSGQPSGSAGYKLIDMIRRAVNRPSNKAFRAIRLWKS
jgi:hypothetical protein